MEGSSKKKLRVVIVDDSAICRVALRHQLEMDGDIEVVAEGDSAFAALELVTKHTPDVVTMDVQMPGKSGLEAVEQIMSRTPTPIIVVTAESLSDEAGVAFQALENGALEIVPKPSMTDEAAASELRALVRRLAGTVVFQRLVEERGPSTKPSPSAAAVELVVVGAGHGGMGSVIGLLGRLPGRMRCPMILYQPVASDSVGSYARYLATSSKQDVTVVQPPSHALVGSQIALVPGLRATIMNRTVLRVERAAPSLDALLASVADVYGPRAVGIVLGGEDASVHEGLGALRKAGGVTLVEAVRTGARSSAVAAGAADAECRVDEIADWLVAAGAF